MNGLNTRIANLSPAKRALLERRLKENFVQHEAGRGITRRAETGPVPLSFAQQRLWFLDQLEPNRALYNIYKALRLKGPLDVEAVTAALSAIVERHEALRTTFHSLDGEPVQVVEDKSSVDVVWTDLATLTQNECVPELQRLLKQEVQRPFNLSSDAMLRVSLFRLEDQEYVLLLVMHHIASDGWSIGVFFHELGILYEAFCKGNPRPLPEPAIQYADFAIWQRQQIQGRVLDAHLSYWTKQLAGIPPLLDLAPGRPRPAAQSHRGGSRAFVLSRELSDGLKALSRQQGVTLYMTLVAAFNVLLYSRTGRLDLVVGTPIAGRNRPELEGLIGFFVNTLVVRTDLSGNPSFRELLDRVRKVVLEAFVHQDLPFDKLVEALHPKRDGSYRSIVQVAFAFQNVPRQPLELPGLTATPVHIDLETAKLDLTLFMRETEDGLAGALNYDTDLFDVNFVRHLLEDFETLLQAVVADPEKRIQVVAPAPKESVSIKSLGDSNAGELGLYESSNLTKNQLLIWAGQKLEPDVPVYNAPFTFTIHGEVDPVHLQKAFATLVNSSDALRTVIRESDGMPQQSVRPDLCYRVDYVDFSKESVPRDAFEVWLQTRCRISFDFAERLFDSALIKIEDKRFVWYLNTHHIIMDGWSRAIVFHWVSELYGRSVAGILPDRVELPSFGDYISYERQHRHTQDFQKAEDYWKRKLAEKSEPVCFYGKSAATRSGRMHRISCGLGVERTKKLRLLAARKEIAGPTENASLYNVIAALLATYLHRITGIRRHSLGTPVHNRKSKAFRDTIGLFMEVLPLRLEVGGRDTFLSLVNKIKAEASEAYRFSHTLANSPQNKAYDVLLNFYSMAFPDFHKMPVETKGLPAAHEHHSLALQIHDFDASGSFVIDFDFHSDVFDTDQCGQAVDHFLQILDAFLKEPNQSVDRPSLLTTEGQRRLLLAFNQTEAAFPGAHVLPLLFQAQVEKTPDHTAITCDGQSLTYAQLNSKANRVAHYLDSLGVGPESVVAICLEPSWEAIVAILGALKAGGAYLPLDLQSPLERLAFMLEDGQASVLLTSRQAVEDHPVLKGLIGGGIDDRSTPAGRSAETDRAIVYIDEDWPDVAAYSRENPVVPITPENLAYVVYTSGSTGTPKGVMVPHRGVCNRLLWEQKIYCFTAADRALQKSSLAFDTSVLEIFRPLLCGATMVVARSQDRHDCRYLVDLMDKQKVSVAEFVPSMLTLLVEEKGIENCTSLKVVFSGGEALSPNIQNRFLARTTAALYNTYGPTEASIDVTHYKCEPHGNSDNVPIGRPIGNTEVYILDRGLNPVPIGVAGELHIGGAGLARGYLNRPELTAERFIPDPFTCEPGGRLYKTGDLARYLHDGNIEFLGRVDHQVKIRGFRVEPGEIESTLRNHPAVQQAVVVARDNAENDKFLVAYVVRVKSQSCGAAELHGHAKGKLPEYMRPAAFVFLDALPLTASGKLDLQALPAPDGTRVHRIETFVAPRNAVEAQMAAIWSGLLGLHRVGVRDNFFDLGGHSLLAVRLFTEIDKVFNKRPPLATLFQEPTVEHLAKLITRGQPATTNPALVPIQPNGVKIPFFCVHEFFGDVFCYRNLARHLGENQPFYALQPRGLDGLEEPFTEVEAMAAYYIENIRAIQPHGPYALGGLCFGGVIAFEMAQQLRAKGDTVALVALLDSGIRLEYGGFEWWWRFFQNLPLDLNSWLTGSLQLTREQWLEVVRIKSAVAGRRLMRLFQPRTTRDPQHSGVPSKRLEDAYQFSEAHQRVAQAQYRALKSYEPRPYGGRLTLFRARMQPFFSSHDRHKGWSRVALGGMQVRDVPGNHLAMLQEPHVQILARELRGCLGETDDIVESQRSA